jgi:hypothetical protein
MFARRRVGADHYDETYLRLGPSLPNRIAGRFDGKAVMFEFRSRPNQLDGPSKLARPDGNRTHVSRICSGVLSQLNYGTVPEARACAQTSGMRF